MCQVYRGSNDIALAVLHEEADQNAAILNGSDPTAPRTAAVGAGKSTVQYAIKFAVICIENVIGK